MTQPYHVNNVVSYYLQEEQFLNSGNSNLLRDKNRKHSLVIQDNGNLVVFKNDPYGAPSSVILWQTGITGGKSEYHFFVTEDGDLKVEQTLSKRVIWETNNKLKKNQGKFFVELTTTGQLLICNKNRWIVWASQSSNQTNQKISGDFSSVPNILLQNQLLRSDVNDGILYDKTNNYYLKMQSDGNVVIYQKDESSQHVVWASHTNVGQSRGPFYLKMQDDGNLCAYDNKNAYLWATGTNGRGFKGQYYAQLKNNGQLLVHDANRDIICFFKQ
ncbi:hypothetical protein RB653_002046 [Dictyostelium firmibasis]|uniref:Bulb-type lectin domain-containing protein n=1 Tax=Dictyostelium firmibasis TaxID=79012 RepID=A0AAN7TWT6_9MYCE